MAVPPHRSPSSRTGTGCGGAAIRTSLAGPRWMSHVVVACPLAQVTGSPRTIGARASGGPAMDDDLADFERASFTHEGKERRPVPPRHGTGGDRDRRDPRHHARRWPASPGASPTSAARPCCRTCSASPGKDPLGGGSAAILSYVLSTIVPAVHQPGVHGVGDRARHRR